MKNNNRTRKLIAPIVITLIICIYFLGIGIFLFCLEEISLVIRILLVIVLTVLSAAAIAVLVQRIVEIRKGEEDDLSKY